MQKALKKIINILIGLYKLFKVIIMGFFKIYFIIFIINKISFLFKWYLNNFLFPGRKVIYIDLFFKYLNGTRYKQLIYFLYPITFKL